MAANVNSVNFAGSPGTWIVDPVAAKGQFTTITAAMAAASSGDVVFVRPGTYTENFTLTSGVYLQACTATGASDNVIITGKITFTGSASATISGFKINTNSDYCIVYSGSSTATLNLKDCFITGTNNSSVNFTNNNASSSIRFFGCTFGVSGTAATHFISTSAGTLQFFNCVGNASADTTASTTSTSSIVMRYTHWAQPIAMSTSGSLDARFCNFISANVLALNIGSGVTATILEFNFGTGTGVTIQADGTVSLFDGIINSSNANAITGSGTLNYMGVFFSSSSTISTTTTSTFPLTRLQGGNGDKIGSASSGNSRGFVNKFYNPCFEVAQRGTTGTISTSGGFTLDGWYATSTGANCVWALSLQNGGHSSTGLQLNGATSVTGIKVRQRIEGAIVGELFTTYGTAQNITFQCSFLNLTGGTVTPTLTVSYATALDNWAGSTVDVNAVSLQPISNGTVGTLAYTWNPAAGSTNGLQIEVDFGNNFSANTKNGYIFAADVRSTPGLTVGLNSTPPLPELRPINVELPICQRYYETSYPNSVAAGSSGITYVQKYPVGAASAGFFTNTFKFQKRATPSVSYWDGAGNASKTSTYVAAGTATNNVNAAVAPTNISVNGFDWGSTAGALIVATGLAWSASAEL